MTRRSREEWKKLIAELEQSGESATDFALRQGIKPRTLLWWITAMKRLSKQQSSKRRAPKNHQIDFVPIAIRQPEIVTGAVEVSLADLVVRFPQGTAAEYVGAVVLELKALC